MIDPGFMMANCAVSCDGCGRKGALCARPPATVPALVPGRIDATMKRLLSEFPQYNPVAISAPGSSNPRVRGTAPWILTLSNFLSDAEVDAFISSCQSHFERSLAGGMCTCVHVCMHTCTHVYMCVYIHTYIHTYMPVAL